MADVSARSVLGLRKEASFGSGGGIDSWQVFESENIAQSKVYAFNDRVRNSPEQIGGRPVHELVAGSITFPVSPANPTQWFEAGIGGTGPYTPQIPLSSLLIEVQKGTIGAEASSGDMIDRIEFESKSGGQLTCAVQVEAKGLGGRAATTVPSTAFPSGDDPYLHEEAIFTLDGVVASNVVGWSVAKSNNLVKDIFANARQRRDIVASKAVVTGSISFIFEDTTMRNRFMNSKPSSIKAQYIRGGRSYTFDLVNIVYDSADRPIQGQSSYLVETLTYTAYVDDPASQNSLKLTVV